MRASHLLSYSRPWRCWWPAGGHCPTGQYNAATPPTLDCVVCPVGYYCSNDDLIPCAEGTYQGSTGRTSCTPCAGGEQGVDGLADGARPSAAVACMACNAGTYSHVGGAADCTDCAEG